MTVPDIANPLGAIAVDHQLHLRDILDYRLWLRSVQRFQAGLFELADTPDPHEAMLAMALHVRARAPGALPASASSARTGCSRSALPRFDRPSRP